MVQIHSLYFLWNESLIIFSLGSITKYPQAKVNMVNNYQYHGRMYKIDVI